jgi:hypothetical protein
MTLEQRQYTAYFFWAALLLTIVFVLCMYKRIKLAIAIVKTGASFVGDVKATLFVPPIVIVFACADIAIYAIGFIYNYSVIPTDSSMKYTNDYGILMITLSD